MVGDTSPDSEKDDAVRGSHGGDEATRVLTDDLFRDTTIPPLRFWLLSVGICLGLFMSMLDSSIVATSLFTIGTEFNDLERMNWVALSYTLSYLGCAVFFSRMTDVIGRRDAFLVAFVIFFAFSLGCGFSHSMDTLIACRALQGVGGSGLYSVTMITLPELSPDRLRKWIASIIGIVIAMAGVLGPVLGGILTEYASWRWVFWVNGPIGAVSMVLFYLTWPKKEFLPNIEKRSWKDLDFLGSFLVIAAPMLGGVAIGSSMGGAISGKKNRIFETLVAATILIMVGCALETTVSDSYNFEPKVLGFLVFIGFGFGLSASSSTMMTVIEASIQDHAPAQGILAQTRIFGGSIGIASSSAILGVKQRTQLGGVVSSSALTGGTQDLTSTQLSAIRKAYNDAFTETMMVCAIVAGVGILLTLGVYRRNRMTIEEQRKEQIREETERRKAQRDTVLTTSSGQSV
ncbi:putative mfs multidrug protein [Phaeoacremonium minimum UCRPA7]|uniref:Putative mfs multidrug protein n=1 Tax=Phaeoacremonium minimum (strain UCR-PA7) TaxID=1286976 RepID=R8BX51_PHAM7|nr:putative mfs multidrug protein [Phaeoacremonium minimum UCRPA7]EOO03912.1 putative mfs multidrug protein [Phaeoacremonium minimum UCRPA7]